MPASQSSIKLIITIATFIIAEEGKCLLVPVTNNKIVLIIKRDKIERNISPISQSYILLIFPYNYKPN